MGIPRQIIGSLGDLGVEIVKEMAKVPGEIVGMKSESHGSSKGKTQGATTTPFPVGGPNVDALNKVTEAPAQEQRQRARSGLEAFAGYVSPKQELTPWEQRKREDEQKKQAKINQKIQDRKSLRPMSTKRKQGQQLVISGKNTEKQKNIIAE